jgi:hypothetical protein
MKTFSKQCEYKKSIEKSLLFIDLLTHSEKKEIIAKSRNKM